jgi:Peptidase family M1 domain
MDMQEDIVNFQSMFNGPFPFTTDGIVIGVPEASFAEEMQTKITFAGSFIDLDTLNHENMHQWWGDNVSEANYNLTFFKEGLATLGEFLFDARTAQTAAGGPGTPAGDAAFEDSLISTFDDTYGDDTNDGLWTAAPSNPSPYTLFDGDTTYTRPGIAYIALRQILGRGTSPRRSSTCNSPTARGTSRSLSWKRASASICRSAHRAARQSSTGSSRSGSTPSTRRAAASTGHRLRAPVSLEADSPAARE